MGGRRRVVLRGLILSVGLGGSLAVPLFAQPATQRTPNVEGTWIPAPWHLHFTFNHRFKAAGGDVFDGGKVTNWPSFGLGLGLWRPASAGVRYTSRPQVGERPNEWFPYLKVLPYSAPGERFAISVLGGYDTGIESWDGELSAQVRLWRFRLLAAARGFSKALATDDAGLALAGGVNLRLNRYLSLAGDVADLVAGPDLKAGWSAGLQVAIPFTPHTLSIQVTNTRSTLLQAASFSLDNALVYGFEFTVPFSGFARWGRIFKPGAQGVQGAQGAQGQVPGAAGERVVRIDVRSYTFGDGRITIPAGTTVRWENGDAVAHTVTADDGSWGSLLIEPGGMFERTFDEPGGYTYHCVPHPFMKGVIVVEGGT